MTVTASSDDPSQAAKRSFKNTSVFCHKISQHFTFAGTPGTHHHPIAVDTLESCNKMASTFKLAGLRCTYIQARQGNGRPGDSFKVVLPNGRNVDVCSKEGADEFVDTVGTDFISSNLNARDVHKLTHAYMLMIAVAEHASTEKIASGIPESELHTYIEHTLNKLDTLSIDRNWLRSGTVSECHVQLLQTIASFAKHSSFLKIFLSSEGMEAVAKFYASRKKNKTPSKSVAQLIVLLVKSCLGAFTQEGLSEEKVFGILEKSGLLGQLIRCVPVDPEGSADIVTCLQACLQLVKKKFKSGMPTGDTLDDVIAGKDGPINEKVKSSLARLQGLARLSNFDTNTCVKMCNHCQKCETLETQMDSEKLMKCQRCKVAYYCNRECQVANWKSHKKMCSSTVSSSAQKIAQTTMWAFVTSNYFDIAKEVYKKTQEYNVPKKELLVEINFYGDAPALRNQFKIWLTSSLLEEATLVDAPDWYQPDAHSKFIREGYDQVTSDDLLFVCRAGNGTVSICSLGLPVGGYQYLSDEAVEAIGREDYIRMVACLGQPSANKYFEKRSGLT
jgi:hypothetical protein